MREQFRSTTSQLVQLKADKENSDKRVQILTASMQRQGGRDDQPEQTASCKRFRPRIFRALKRGATATLIRVEMPATRCSSPARPGFVPARST